MIEAEAFLVPQCHSSSQVDVCGDPQRSLMEPHAPSPSTPPAFAEMVIKVCPVVLRSSKSPASRAQTPAFNFRNAHGQICRVLTFPGWVQEDLGL